MSATQEMRSAQLKIGGRAIGARHSPYVIAEIGSNHDGDLGRAFKLIDVAAQCGADAAKFQYYRADKLYPGQHTPGAIPGWWLLELQEHARSRGIEFLASVFCIETLESYMLIDPPAIKIASPEAQHYELLHCAASMGLPLIVATGACTWTDVDAVARIVTGPLVLLHCVSAYPAPPGEMNLRAIEQMAERYRCPVGLSDHTLHGPAPATAVALGATVIEKHLTTDRRLAGADHPFALEPAEFAAMVADVREAWGMLGDGVKRVTASEDPLDRRVAA